MYAAALVAMLLGPLGGGKPVEVEAASLAANRCNSQTIDDASARVRDFDRHGPGASPAQLLTRYGAIADVIATLNEEQEILDSVCPSDAYEEALFAQIAATTAWALVLEADVAARINASCPAATQAFPTMMLADAWLRLANIINDQGGRVPPAFAQVVPKVQAHAQAVNLALPVWADTSAYWRDQIRAKAKAAIQTCPTPSPLPRP